MAKPSPKRIAADQARMAEYQLERVLGSFMGMDGAAAVRQLTDMFAAKPVLLELNGKPMEAING